jgi:NIMA (never in mitosis gene a)-related kinase 1/4/5
MAEDSSGISTKIPDIMAPVYRAPELIPKPQSFDNKIDIWAFGCVLFEMTTQRRAFNGEGEIRTFMARPEKIKVFELDRGDMNEDMITSAKLAEGLINEILQVDFNRRPSADSVLKKIDTCIYLKTRFNRT